MYVNIKTIIILYLVVWVILYRVLLQMEQVAVVAVTLFDLLDAFYQIWNPIPRWVWPGYTNDYPKKEMIYLIAFILITIAFSSFVTSLYTDEIEEYRYQLSDFTSRVLGSPQRLDLKISPKSNVITVCGECRSEPLPDHFTCVLPVVDTTEEQRCVKCSFQKRAASL